jgi:glutamate/tyrosine decarboxylase-like PLP-dependent enzyme
VLRGLELADSLVLDPHKWLFAPYDVGCLFVRRPGVLERTFSMRPEYLADVRPATPEVNFGDRSLELTRRSRALKLWLMLKVNGAGRVRGAIERCIGLAEHAQRLLESDPSWEVVTPAQLGIVTFACREWSAEEHSARAAGLAADGFATVTSTVLRDRSVLRLCTINPLTTETDIEETLQRLGGDQLTPR